MRTSSESRTINRKNEKALEYLHDLGFAIHWLRAKSKVPEKAGWTTGPRFSWDELIATKSKDSNVGVRLGRASKVGAGYLAVIDVDIKSENPADIADCQRALKEMFPSVGDMPRVISGRGNGSSHYYCLLSRPIRKHPLEARSEKQVRVQMPSAKPSKRERDLLDPKDIKRGTRIRAAWEISVMCEGRQVVLPPSIHPDTGQRYAWAADRGVKAGALIPFIEAPSAEEESALSAQSPNASRHVDFQDVDVKSLGLKPDQVSDIVDGLGVEDRSAAVFGLCMALVRRGISDDIILSVFTDTSNFLGQIGFDHAKTKSRERAARWVRRYCLAPAKSKIEETDFVSQTVRVLDSGGVKAEAGKDRSYLDALDFSRPKNGAPILKATFSNAVAIFQNEISSEMIKLNEFTGDEIWGADTPFGPKKGDKRTAKGEDEIRAKKWLVDSFGVDFPMNIIREAFLFIVAENKFHPVKDYLGGLEWDGKSRIDTAFKTYLGATAPEPYLTEVTRKFFRALIARIYEPGVKFDHMVIFVGEQGIGKSTFGPMLVGKDWFLDALPNVQDKDAAMNIQGIWLCEVAEMVSIYRSANEAVKAFVSRTIDKVRPPYGERRVDMPRTTVFYGTTNNHEFLTDPTGGRRFWPIVTKGLDFKGLTQDRHQLLAEAKCRYDTDDEEKLYLGREAQAVQKHLAEMHSLDDETSDMECRLTEWLDADCPGGFDLGKLSMLQLFDSPLGPFYQVPKTQINFKAAAVFLRKKGFERLRTNKGIRWKRQKSDN